MIGAKSLCRKFFCLLLIIIQPLLLPQYKYCLHALSIKGGIRSKRYKPYVKTLHGKLVGNAHPVHHPSCRAVTKEIQELQEMDRACRAKIRASHLALKHSEKFVSRSFEFVWSFHHHIFATLSRAKNLG